MSDRVLLTFPSLAGLIQINRGRPVAAHFARSRRSYHPGRFAVVPTIYSARETLRDGRSIEIRALRPQDEANMLLAVDRIGAESLQRRFFVTKHGFSESEK
jgi:hypothetical protein